MRVQQLCLRREKVEQNNNSKNRIRCWRLSMREINKLRVIKSVRMSSKTRQKMPTKLHKECIRKKARIVAQEKKLSLNKLEAHQNPKLMKSIRESAVANKVRPNVSTFIKTAKICFRKTTQWQLHKLRLTSQAILRLDSFASQVQIFRKNQHQCIRCLQSLIIDSPLGPTLTSSQWTTTQSTSNNKVNRLTRWQRKLLTLWIQRNWSNTCWPHNNSKMGTPNRKWLHLATKEGMSVHFQGVIATYTLWDTWWWNNRVCKHVRPQLIWIRMIQSTKEKMPMLLSQQVEPVKHSVLLVEIWLQPVRSRHQMWMALMSGHLLRTGARDEQVQITRLTKKWIWTSSSVLFSNAATIPLQLRPITPGWHRKVSLIFINQITMIRSHTIAQTWR